MRTGLFVGLALWGSLAMGCKGDSGVAKPTREECAAVSEHIAGLILAEKTSKAEEWYDAIKAEPDADKSGLPSDLPRTAFKLWLDSPEGRTWLMQRRTNLLVGVQQGIDGCVENATKAQVKCLLASKSKDDVVVCDQKFKRKSDEPAPTSGSAAPSAGSAQGSSEKPFVPPATPPNQMPAGEYGPAGTGSSTP